MGVYPKELVFSASLCSIYENKEIIKDISFFPFLSIGLGFGCCLTLLGCRNSTRDQVLPAMD